MSNQVVVVINKFNSINDENAVLTEPISSNNLLQATQSFIKWCSKLSNTKFQIMSTKCNFAVTFTIYQRQCNDRDTYIVILNVALGESMLNASYRIDNDISRLDIDNLSDIISIVAKVSAGEITHFTEKSIIGLIDLRMTTIATKIE